jgi:hypothetical protein
MPILDLPDPEKGREMFEGLYGPESGRRRFRAVLLVLVPLAVVAAILFVLAQITSSGASIYSEVRGWFSPPSTTAQPSSPVQPQGCIVSGGENRGSIVQTCK